MLTRLKLIKRRRTIENPEITNGVVYITKNVQTGEIRECLDLLTLLQCIPHDIAVDDCSINIWMEDRREQDQQA